MSASCNLLNVMNAEYNIDYYLNAPILSIVMPLGYNTQFIVIVSSSY